MHATVTTNQAVKAILEYIRAQEYSIGDRLPSIRELSHQLDLGPHLIRDGLMQAQALGLVRIHPRAGSFVQSLNALPLVESLNETISWGLMQVDQNLFHLIETRLLIELETVRLAVDRRRKENLLPLLELLNSIEQTYNDDAVRLRGERCQADIEFHLEIARLAGNPVLTIILRSLLERLRPCFVTLFATPDAIELRDSTHRGIYQAILNRDADVARQLMTEHLQLARVSLMQMVENAD